MENVRKQGFCRKFLEMGLFSGLSKPEVNEYIASRSKARLEDFRNRESSSRATSKFSVYLVINISRLYSSGSGADD